MNGFLQNYHKALENNWDVCAVNTDFSMEGLALLRDPCQDSRWGECQAPFSKIDSVKWSDCKHLGKG